MTPATSKLSTPSATGGTNHSVQTEQEVSSPDPVRHVLPGDLGSGTEPQQGDELTTGTEPSIGVEAEQGAELTAAREIEKGPGLNVEVQPDRATEPDLGQEPAEMDSQPSPPRHQT